MDYSKPPSIAAVIIARANSGLTQEAAARQIYVTARSWQHYEAGTREMSAASFELFQLKAGQHEKLKLTEL